MVFRFYDLAPELQELILEESKDDVKLREYSAVALSQRLTFCRPATQRPLAA